MRKSHQNSSEFPESPTSTFPPCPPLGPKWCLCGASGLWKGSADQPSAMMWLQPLIHHWQMGGQHLLVGAGDRIAFFFPPHLT